MKFEEKVAGLRIKKHKGRETKEFLEDIVLLAKSEAYEYLLGEVDFCGAKIDLSLHPMIPRKETEYWVNQAIKIEKENEEETEKEREMASPFRALDLFSGSGNVGLAILKNISKCKVDFIEFDSNLKEQIEISINKNKLEKSRTRVFVGDVWEVLQGDPLQGTQARGPLVEKYNIITAVPPYVPPQMREEVMSELGAENPLSFFDKEDGYYFHKQILSKAKDYLKDGRVLYLEFDITQREKIEELAKENNWTTYTFLRDPYGHEFVIRLVK